jgi:hypothetical protein
MTRTIVGSSTGSGPGPLPEIKSEPGGISSGKSATLGSGNRVELPPLERIMPTTPLRLAVAARLAFPDGSMSEKALRELGHARKLTVELIRGKHYTTLADIEEMRKLCRVQAKARGSVPTSGTEKQCGSSATDSGTTAQAALSEKVRKASEVSRPRKKNSGSTSAKNTTQPQAGVIPLKPP